MSRLYCKITPDRKSTMTKCAFKHLVVETNGWKVGIRVESFRDEKDQDAFRIYRTGGNEGFKQNKLIGTVTADGEFQRASHEAAFPL